MINTISYLLRRSGLGFHFYHSSENFREEVCKQVKYLSSTFVSSSIVAAAVKKEEEVDTDNDEKKPSKSKLNSRDEIMR